MLGVRLFVFWREYFTKLFSFFPFVSVDVKIMCQKYAIANQKSERTIL